MKKMFKAIGKFFGRVAGYVKAIFSKDVQAEVCATTEETFLEEPVEAKAEVITNKVILWGARVLAGLVAYIVVMNFPLTILLVIEIMAVYKAIRWAFGKVIANA